MEKRRIECIDIFRFIAISSVMLYHFYWRWPVPANSINIPSNGHQYAQVFSYGYLGVDFFFIISGFVIFFSLEHSVSLVQFLINRLVRLIPSLLLCSMITFFLVGILDHKNQFEEFHSETWLNFLPSLTFSTPDFWNVLFHRDDINYISGSYWSLSVEFSFYVLAGCLYFFNKKKFLMNWVSVMYFLMFLRLLSSPKWNTFFSADINSMLAYTHKCLLYFSVPYFFYFTIGILMFTLFAKKKIEKIELVLASASVAIEIILMHGHMKQAIVAGMIILFVIFIYKQEYFSSLNLYLISRVGTISYTLYLIHENIGILLINKFSILINMPMLNAFIPLLVILIFVIFSEASYRFFEQPLSMYLKELFWKPSLKKKSGFSSK